MTTEPSRLDEIEAVWALAARIGGFLLGCVLGTILVVTKQEAMWPYLLVIGLCGPSVAISVARVLEGARGRNGSAG